MTETRKAFHDELVEVRADVVALGTLASEAVRAGTDAFLGADLRGVENLVAGDRRLDDLTHAIESRTYLLLATQQPMAVDLRLLVTVLRVIHELERVGDLMVNVAKATRRLYPGELEAAVRGIIEAMRQQAVVQLYVAMSAFAHSDPGEAGALSDMDDAMDDLQKDLFRAIFASTADDEAAVQRAVQIALVGRYFERIADHAVNVGERVAFMVTGAFPDDATVLEG